MTGKKLKCVNSNNGLPRNPECRCVACKRDEIEYASQITPHMHPFDDCADDCWECVKQAQWWQKRASR